MTTRAELKAGSFLARSRKAIAGAISGASVAILAQLPALISDGAFTGDEFWAALTFALGGAVIGFAGVWAAPANKGA